jgi:two-component system sensor histidine kinase UhpB
MKVFDPKTWGITARLVLVATVPAFLMFVVVNVALYITGQGEVQEALKERGQLIAAALAETSQYGVVSGNVAYLERNVRQLLKTDPSIAAISILDPEHKPIVTERGAEAEGAYVFERAIATEVPDVNLFDQGGGPHVSVPSASTPFRAGRTLGFVRVSMSAKPILEEKRHRLYLGGLVVFAATLVSGIAGLWLALRLRAPLRSVMRVLRQIRGGNYDVRLSAHASGELGELQGAIVEMAKGLSVTRQELEGQVLSRTQELQHAVEAVSEADDEKRLLIARSNELLEEERQRIAVEIHDDLNASLIVVQMKAQHIASLADQAPSPNSRDEIKETALAISKTTVDLYASARNIVKRLRPEVIDTLGLKGAVQEMVRNYDEFQSSCVFSLRVGDDFPDLRGQLAITCYRLVQEALSNVAKHAEATRASVALQTDQRPPALFVTITDDGKGFDTSMRSHDRMGLISMRERVAAVAGSISIHSAPGQGTTIEIRLPLPPH